MRALAIFTAILLSGCGPEERSEALEPVPAAITFDGADATGPAQVAHGERISRVLGCHGCHGEGLIGQEWDNDPKGYGLLWASNLTRAIPTMTDAQIDTLMRTGVHPTRAQMWVMPSEIFQHISDADLAALKAYLRTLKPTGEVAPQPVLGPKAIEEWKSGKVTPAADTVHKAEYRLPPDLGAASAQGRYIASMTCTECHGGQLRGKINDTPDLIVAGSYSRAEFEKFMTTGVPTGNRTLKDPLMSQVARGRFAKMTVSERDQLYAYLKTLAEQPR